jgi:hypothetical protein
MRRSSLGTVPFALGALALAGAIAGCTFQTSEDPVYYNPHAQHLVGGAGSGTPSEGQPGTLVNGVSPDPSGQPPVQAGVTQGICNNHGSPSGCDPEPSPWNGGGGSAGAGTTPGGVSNIKLP